MSEWGNPEWVEQLPENVRAVADQFPICSEFRRGRWVAGYDEYEGGGIGLLLIDIPPGDDFTDEEFDQALDRAEEVDPDLVEIMADGACPQ